MTERRWLAAGVLIVGLASLALWCPVLDGATRVWSGVALDADQFVWSMEHTLRRIAEVRNPFVAEAIFANSAGANLAFNTTAPGVAVIVAPATLLAGPLAGLAAATIALPVAMFVVVAGLLRSATAALPVARRTAAAVVVALSPFVVVKNGHHVNLVAGAVVVVGAAWAAHRWWCDDRPRTAIVFGATLDATVWMSTEMIVHGVIATIVGFVAAAVAAHSRRRGSVGAAIRHTAAELRVRRRQLVLIAAVAVVVASPFLAAFAFGPQRFTGDYHADQQSLFGIDPTNLVRPDRSRALFALFGDDIGELPAEATGYITIVGLAIAVWLSVRYRRASAIGRTAIIAYWLLTVLSLGPSLHVGDRQIGALPWRLVDRLPVVGQAIPNRLSFFALLALVVAVVDGTRSFHLRRGLAVAGAAMFVALWLPVRPFPTQSLERQLPDALADSCADTTVLVTPPRGGFGVTYMQRSMSWQADAGFTFDLVRGWAFRADSPPSGEPLLLDEFADSDRAATADELAELRGEVRSAGAGCVVAPDTAGETLIELLGEPAQVVDGWQVWAVTEL